MRKSKDLPVHCCYWRPDSLLRSVESKIFEGDNGDECLSSHCLKRHIHISNLLLCTYIYLRLSTSSVLNTSTQNRHAEIPLSAIAIAPTSYVFFVSGAEGEKRSDNCIIFNLLLPGRGHGL